MNTDAASIHVASVRSASLTPFTRLQLRLLVLLQARPLGAWVALGRLAADEQIPCTPWSQRFQQALGDLEERGIIRQRLPAERHLAAHVRRGFPHREVSLNPVYVLDVLEQANELSVLVTAELDALLDELPDPQ